MGYLIILYSSYYMGYSSYNSIANHNGVLGFKFIIGFNIKNDYEKNLDITISF